MGKGDDFEKVVENKKKKIFKKNGGIRCFC